jgi:hypothetical protein
VRSNPFVLRDIANGGLSTHPYRHDDEPASAVDPGAVVRSIGTCRKVFLLNSALTPPEIDGLAYRVGVMSANGGINSILIGNPIEDSDRDGDMTENATVLPGFMEEDDPGKHLDPPPRGRGGGRIADVRISSGACSTRPSGRDWGLCTRRAGTTPARCTNPA